MLTSFAILFFSEDDDQWKRGIEATEEGLTDSTIDLGIAILVAQGGMINLYINPFYAVALFTSENNKIINFLTSFSFVLTFDKLWGNSQTLPFFNIDFGLRKYSSMFQIVNVKALYLQLVVFGLRGKASFEYQAQNLDNNEQLEELAKEYADELQENLDEENKEGEFVKKEPRVFEEEDKKEDKEEDKEEDEEEDKDKAA